MSLGFGCSAMHFVFVPIKWEFCQWLIYMSANELTQSLTQNMYSYGA